jgi:molybdopterin converting factor small subunit
MARVSLELPGLLRDAVGVDRLELVAATPAAALAAAAAAVPALRTHLFDSRGAPRRHVLCIRDERPVRGEALHALLADGDRLRVQQAVSGG